MIHRVHIMTPTLHSGDAVSNDVLGMRDWLIGRGVDARAYAHFVGPELRDTVFPLEAYHAHLRDREALLIFHHSIYWPQGLAYFGRTLNRRVLKYHGVTPAKFFKPYDPVLKDACRLGRWQLRILLRQPIDALWSDSHSNARDFHKHCKNPYHVLPPFHGIEDLSGREIDQPLAQKLRGDINFLFVGRIAPNKGHSHLIRAFSHYCHRRRGQGKLFFVGPQSPSLTGYRHMLEREIARQGLCERVLFTHQISASQLRTFYQHCHVFVCASEHEGFCVPLVEAMHFGLPIAGYGMRAVMETMGGSGMLWDEPDPILLGESLHTIVTRSEVRDLLIQGQHERYLQCYAPKALEATFEKAWNELTVAPLSRVRVGSISDRSGRKVPAFRQAANASSS